MAIKPPQWHDIVAEYLPGCESGVATCLASACSLLLEDSTVCPALVLVGPPSSFKTTIATMIEMEPLTVVLDNFSSKAFVSHYATKQVKKLKDEVDMLYKIKHKLLIVPDLGPFFDRRTDDLAESLGVLTRVLDGQGYVSHSGVHGRRGDHGDYRFGLLAATTPIGGQVWKVMSALGPRLLMLNIKGHGTTVDEQVDDMTHPLTFGQRLAECKEAVQDTFRTAWESGGGKVGGLVWDRKGDDRRILAMVARLAALGSVMRSQTAREKRTGADDYEYQEGVLEGPGRYRQSLYNLARGSAISKGRTTLEVEDLFPLLGVVMSTGPTERVSVMKYVASGRTISVSVAQHVIGHAWHTADLALKSMIGMGLLEGDNEIVLAEEYKWLTTLWKEYVCQNIYIE